MLKFFFFVFICLTIYLVLNYDLESYYLRVVNNQEKLAISNLFENPKIEINSKTIKKVSKTCCNSFLNFTGQHSYSKLEKICKTLPYEVNCMKNCLEIRAKNLKDFNSTIDPNIEHWIQNNLNFQEVVCDELFEKNELQKKNAKEEFKKLNKENRMNKEQIYELIKQVAKSLDLKALDNFEYGLVINKNDSNEIIISERGFEILKQLQIVSKLIKEENQNRLLDNFKYENYTSLFTGNKLKSEKNKYSNKPTSIPKTEKNLNNLNFDFEKKKNFNYLNPIKTDISNKNFFTNDKPFNYYQTQNYLENKNYLGFGQNNLRNHQFTNNFLAQNNILDKNSFRYSKKEIDENTENETSSSITKLSFSNHLKCIAISLNETFVNYLKETYPSLNIFSLDVLNKFENLVDSTPNKRLKTKSVKGRDIFNESKQSWETNQRDGIDEFFAKQVAQPNNSVTNSSDVKKFLFKFDIMNNIPSKLIKNFSNSPHKSLTDLSKEALKNSSSLCQQDIQSKVSYLIINQLKLSNYTSNAEKILKVDRLGMNSININDIVKIIEEEKELISNCNDFIDVFVYLNNLLEKCLSFSNLKEMIDHTFLETKSTINFCFKLQMRNFLKIVDSIHLTEPNSTYLFDKSFYIDDYPVDISQLKIIFNCLDWNDIKKCQIDYLPWIKNDKIKIKNDLMVFKEKELSDDKSNEKNLKLKFKNMNLNKNLTSSELNELKKIIMSHRCKDVILYKNCINEKVSKSFNNLSKIGFEKKDDKCKMYMSLLDKNQLSKRLSVKLTNKIESKMNNYCPSLSSLVGLDEKKNKISKIEHLTNVKKYFSNQFKDISSIECYNNTQNLVEFCIERFNKQLDVSYFELYLNLELKSQFENILVSNEEILKRVCCAQRQLGGCLASAAIFKCLRNNERSKKFFDSVGLNYCKDFYTNYSMSKCKNILSTNLKEESTSFSFKIESSLKIFCFTFLIKVILIFIFRFN